MLLKNPTKTGGRRGVILMVVLALLTLFAILGVTFVLYANAEATTARINREAEDLTLSNLPPGPTAQQALNIFLGQLLYDLPDDATTGNLNGVYSALRGHSLARLAYGYSGPGGMDDKAFTGVGRLHYQSPFPTSAINYAKDDSYLVNFTYYLTDGFLRDPERYGTRPNLGAPEGAYTGGANVPYTYPDLQNMFLAMIRPSDGKVLMPSFHRPWLFGQYNAANPNISNAEGKYLTCLVRPQEMGAGFPTPDSNMLSVQNLPGGSGNDSGWVDIGAPGMVTPSGIKYKMLVAPLIIELDSRLNLNVLGNILGVNNAHASNQGWGLTEVNLSKLLNASSAPNEWQNIFLGNPASTYTTNPKVQANPTGRYGNSKLPKGTPLAAGTSARQWAQVDLNGTADPPPGGAATAAFAFPGNQGGALPYQIFPTFPPIGFGNGIPLETQDNQTPPNQIHPLIFNSQRPVSDNRTFGVWNLYPLLNYANPNSYASFTDWYRLCPTNFANDTADPACPKRRNLVTLLSADLERVAGTPYIYDAMNAGNVMPQTRFQFNTTWNGTSWTLLTPTGNNPIGYPSLSPRATPPNTAPNYSDFDPTTLRSLLGAYLKVDLNRSLTPWPIPDPTTGLFDKTNPFTPNPATLTQAQQALGDRQRLASDIFNALQRATGALDPTTTLSTYGPTSPEFYAVRYLAQLAVNIVDFIDYDDYSTPFNFLGSTNPASVPPAAAGNLGAGWVVGTELPRLVLNEVYAQLDNNATDPGPLANPVTKATMAYNVNIWAELHNPFVTDAVPNSPFGQTDQTAILHNGSYANYIVTVVDQTASQGGITNLHQNLRDPGNVLGDPLYSPTGPQAAPANGWSVVQDYIPTANGTPTVPAANYPFYRAVGPNNNAYVTYSQASPPPNPLTAPPNGFYVLGPDVQFVNNTKVATPYNADPQLLTISKVKGMSYTWALPPAVATDPPPGAATVQPVVLLRRLACPGLPPNPPLNPANGTPNMAAYNPALPFNPYITVDYVEFNVNGNNGGKEVNDTRLANSTAAVAPQPVAPSAAGTTCRSFGRTQPYAAAPSQRLMQNPNPLPTGQPPNTFFRHNAVEAAAPPLPTTPGQTLKIPFDWLVHLDRQVISPMELWHVSGFKPHELTQQFVTGAGPTAPAPQHTAPWTDQTTRLYRFFEFVTAKSRANGVALNGRIPGKININMVWDLPSSYDIFKALCDAQPGNLFADSTRNLTNQMGQGINYTAGPQAGQPVSQNSDVQTVFQNLISLRSPTPDGAGGYMPGPNDAPFWGFAVGYAGGGDAMDPTQIPNGAATPRGIWNSLLRPIPPNPGNPYQPTMVFDSFPPDSQLSTNIPPYQRMQLLTKIQNYLTTRSNVFAVWLTTGFFQVVDDSTQPIKLGAELGASTGTQVRHHMFAIVDRSNLTAFSTNTTAAINVPPPTPPQVQQPFTSPLQIAASGTNANTGRAWNIQAGTVLVYDPNTDNEETVVAQPNGMGGFQANFYKTHASGATVICRGNPGPWANYDPRNDPLVVPFYYIID